MLSSVTLWNGRREGRLATKLVSVVAAVVAGFLLSLTPTPAQAGTCVNQKQVIVRSSRVNEDVARTACAPVRKNVERRSAGRRTGERHRTANRSFAGQRFGGEGSMLFCVRLGDGYFFPTPHSQFDREKDEETTMDMCRHICADPAMDVYVLRDPSLETEEMVSLSAGTRYADLPSARAYQSRDGFRPCDMQRYFRRVDEARARLVTPYDLRDVVVPLPTGRPDRMADASEPAKSPTRTVLRVRDVGPVFLPQ